METIRRIEEGDFKAVSALYNGRKSIEELKWLLSNPDNPNQYNAFVAEKDKNIVVGVIGYSLSTYIQGDKKIIGVIPLNWKIIDHYKGMAGVLLFKKVLSLGDFGIAISGSKTAQDLYPLFKYQYKTDISQFYKILNLPSMIKYYRRKSVIKTFGMIGKLSPSFFNITKKGGSPYIEFLPYTGNNFTEDIKSGNKVFRKQISKKYIDWLLSCPVLETYGFNIKDDKINYGICVLYIQIKDRMKIGRIIHIPYLGEDKKLWKCVISQCTSFFKEKNCTMVSGLALHEMNYSGYSDSGYIKIKKHGKPLFIKDINNSLNDYELNNWLIQYSEGDKGYRSF